jgi:CspA family cold shock protein
MYHWARVAVQRDLNVFVHVSAAEGASPLRDGQKVSYDIGRDRKTGKSRAENVRSA